ncbi:sensor histidine kinase, partial [Pseudomonas syringae pv. tagetis]
AAFVERVGGSRDIFLAILGHDLRGALQAVSMSAELLARMISPVEKAQSYISGIQLSSGKLGAMVGEVIVFVRSGVGSGLPVERK